MPRDGSGGYSRTHGWVEDAGNAIDIEADRHDDHDDDLGNEIANSLAKDGQTVATAAIPFALGIQTDTVAEKTSGAGVTVDGLLIKDGLLPLSGLSILWGLKNLETYMNADFDRWGRSELNSASSGVNAWGTANLTYGCDGWAFQRGSGATATVTRQIHTPGQTVVPDNPELFARYAVTVAGTGDMKVSKIIEGVQRYSGQTITVGLYVRCNLSGRTATPSVRQDFGSGGSPSADVTTSGSAVNLTQNVWTLVSATIAVPSISGKTVGTTLTTSYLAVEFDLGASAIGEWDFSHFILTPGSALGPFIKPPFAVDQQMCMRYFQALGETRFAADGTDNNNNACPIFLPQQMRVAPTITLGTATDTNVQAASFGAITTAVREGGFQLQFAVEPAANGYASRSYATVHAVAEIAI